MIAKRQYRSNLSIALTLFFAMAVQASASAGPDASDFMQGSPPPLEARVTKANWFMGPYNRWGLQHVREITATIEIPRGDGPVHKLPKNPKPIGHIPVKTMDGKSGTITDWLEASYTDGFLVLHKGEILTEVYMNGMTDRSYHNFFSMSKSFTGTMAGIIADQGLLDTTAKVSKYVPEMIGGAYGDATVRQLMDMTIGIKYS